jgi:hypothetical protein
LVCSSFEKWDVLSVGRVDSDLTALGRYKVQLADTELRAYVINTGGD